MRDAEGVAGDGDAGARRLDALGKGRGTDRRVLEEAREIGLPEAGRGKDDIPVHRELIGRMRARRDRTRGHEAVLSRRQDVEKERRGARRRGDGEEEHGSEERQRTHGERILV